MVKLKNFEICIANHKKNEKTYKHFHKSSTEYNIVLDGNLIVNGKKLKKNDIFIYYKKEISDVKFLSNVRLLVVRIPSSPKDKVIINDK